jgi:hypothetical protein
MKSADRATMRSTPAAPRYLRVSIARWKINLHSAEAERVFRQIETPGLPSSVRSRASFAIG